MNAVAETPARTQAHGGGTTISQYMSFIINERNYAFALTHVAEITPFCELTQMPHTPKCVEGLLDLRGHVLPVISLRTILNLPKKETRDADSILIITHEGARIGVLVDQIESVISATEEQHEKVSPMIVGKDGNWVWEILLLNGKVILVLDPDTLLNLTQAVEDKHSYHLEVVDDIEVMLDNGLKDLIAMSEGDQDGEDSGKKKIAPQIETVIADTESEVLKVLERMEAMLEHTDKALTGLKPFRQELDMGRGKGLEKLYAELSTITHSMQDDIFDIMQQLQFQAIVRQKLEKSLKHIIGMHKVIAYGVS
jgi:purine-binding chemotaxis protein CheW